MNCKDSFLVLYLLLQILIFVSWWAFKMNYIDCVALMVILS